MTQIHERTEIVEEQANVDERAHTSEPARTTPAAESVGSTRRTYLSRSTMRPSSAEVTRRVIVFLFGLVQVVIGLRVLFLLLDAREANALVRFILDLSQVFVVPFEGILRTGALQARGSILDLTAILAIVGWTVLELVVLWGINVFRREPS